MADIFPISKLAVLGPGLLGGSLCLAAKKNGLATQIALWGRREQVVQEAAALEIADQCSTSLEAVVSEADLIILCTPIGAMKELLERAKPMLKPGCVVTDVGSVKGIVVKDCEQALAGTEASFVGSHPMAGSERSGLQFAREDLFERATCILTPTIQTPPAVLELARALWTRCGAVTCECEPDRHDEIVATISHLPHALAAVLVDFVCSQPGDPVKYAGSGLRDTTRVASGPVEMWREILCTNRKPLAAATRGLITRLEKLVEMLETGDEAALLALLDRAKQQRDDFIVKKHG